MSEGIQTRIFPFIASVDENKFGEIVVSHWDFCKMVHAYRKDHFWLEEEEGKVEISRWVSVLWYLSNFWLEYTGLTQQSCHQTTVSM